ncbi:hypothetical protein [Cognataquiflexum aquatile]|uniref:hypothetical protein n=1 Tax=Cognataquiflexum aquatile TaxID=2249427 RepID=UPI0013003B54|nr:hypothetical protein [Cognataquiflexum aquatile]
MKDRKHIFLLMATGMLLFGCSQTKESKEKLTNSNTIETASIDTEYIIEGNSIEGFKIGDTYSEKSPELNYEKKLSPSYTDEGIDTLNMVSVSDKSGKLFDIVLEEMTIQKIWVGSRRCKTKDGISVNSSLSDFTKTYPDFEIFYSYVSDSFWASTKSLTGVQFHLDKECYSGSKDGLNASDMVELDPKEFNQNCKIVSIAVF